MNARKAGAIPIYYGSNVVYKFINKKSFVNCSPDNAETIDAALNRCVQEVKYLDQNDKATSEMLSSRFLRKNISSQYTKIGRMVSSILSCKIGSERSCDAVCHHHFHF